MAGNQRAVGAVLRPFAPEPNAERVYWFREPFEISRTHTLEVQVDLVSARAPHRVVSLTLGRYVFDPFAAPDRPFIAHGRWLATTWWDAPIRLWDLEKAPTVGSNDQGREAPLELGRPGHVYDMDFSPDTNYVALVGADERVAIWNSEPAMR